MSNSELSVQRLYADESTLWDRYVQQHRGHSPYHLSSWLAAIAQTYSHDVYYFAAKQGAEIVGVLPLVNIRIPVKGSSLCSLPFCDVGGVLADNEEIKIFLEERATELKLTLKANSIEYRERAEVQGDIGLEGRKVSMILPLPATSEALFSGFKSKLRSQIRKAEKNGLTYELGTNQQFIDNFYEVFSENMLRLGSPVHSKKWIESICEQYKEQSIICVVKSGDIPVGAGLVLFTNGKACIPWASTRAEFNRLSPNMMVYWALLKFVTEQGCTLFDFGRSTFNEGTFRFKKQWGAEPALLKWRTDVETSVQSDNTGKVSSIKRLVETIWQKLPLSLANYLGPKLRRYISL